MYPSETAACHSTPNDPFWTFLNLICWRNLALLRTPNNIIFWIGHLKQIFGTFVRKKKIIPFFRNEVIVLLSEFQSSCTLLGCEQRFLVPYLSGLQRSLFINLQMMFFPPTWWPLLANFCESCLVEFPVLYLALFRILLAASLRILGRPVLFLSSNPSFLDDHFTTQRSDFFRFLEISDKNWQKLTNQ